MTIKPFWKTTQKLKVEGNLVTLTLPSSPLKKSTQSDSDRSIMKVLIGATSFTIGVSNPATSSSSSDTASFGGGRDQEEASRSKPSYLFMKEEDEDEINSTRKGKFGSGFSSSSSSSSSIGAPDDSEEEEEEDDAVSSTVQKSGSFGCLTSLEDSLPIKRGLSSHYTGKSKSFGNLQDMSSSCTSANDFVKPENPFNKRRRILMANKLHRKNFFYAGQNPKSMPILASLIEQEEDENENEDHGQDQNHGEDNYEDEILIGRGIPKLYGAVSKLKASGFKTCFSLADLQEHDEEFDQ